MHLNFNPLTNRLSDPSPLNVMLQKLGRKGKKKYTSFQGFSPMKFISLGKQFRVGYQQSAPHPVPPPVVGNRPNVVYSVKIILTVCV